jgi:hypothetical protein
LIDTREELIAALTEACELEHGLLLQYLFTAYSLKKSADEGLGGEEQEIVRKWEGVITGVAREEMAHLGSVCNMLSAVGGAPRLGRPNFPQPRGSYYPFDFRLMAFGDEALYRFICFELPEDEPPPEPPAEPLLLNTLAVEQAVVPDPLVFKFIGQLYRQIEDGFEAIPEDELFIGPRFAQDVDQWSNFFKLHRVVDRESAKKAIDFIVREGEGSRERREGSHYDRFRDIREELAARPELVAARPVVSDPRTRAHRDAPLGGTIIENRHTIAVAELANAVYSTMMLLLLQYYGFGEETAQQRDAIRSTLRHLMSGVFRPLAETLTEMPAGKEPEAGTAGPPFELYSDLRISPHLDSRWTILLERLDAEAAEADELAAAGAPSRLGFLAENLRWIRINLAEAAREDA